MKTRKIAVLSPGYATAGMILWLKQELGDFQVIGYDTGRKQKEQKQIEAGLKKAGVHIWTVKMDLVQEMKDRAQPGYKFDIPTAGRPWHLTDLINPKMQNAILNDPISNTPPTQIYSSAQDEHGKNLLLNNNPNGPKLKYIFPIANRKIKFSVKKAVKIANEAGIKTSRELQLTRTGIWSDPYRTKESWRDLRKVRPEKFEKAVYEEKNAPVNWISKPLEKL